MGPVGCPPSETHEHGSNSYRASAYRPIVRFAPAGRAQSCHLSTGGGKACDLEVRRLFVTTTG